MSRAAIGDRAIGSVLIIEDDPRSAALMEAVLEPISRAVLTVTTAATALDALADSTFDLVTLDLGLPDLDGMDLLHHIREMSSAPVIVVSALAHSASIVAALSAGADDYVVKPVRPAELRARAEAVSRRTRSRAEQVERYTDDRLTIDLGRSVIVTERGSVVLSSTERRLLRELVQSPGRVLTYEELLRRVWGTGYETDVQNLQVFISYLRHKLDDNALRPSYIRTHRGIGYEFTPADDADEAPQARPA